ncbi:DUSAM domain-containing protein [Hyalangium rubrum]|uniref:DUSAM domain-containing protein n=1 Tax=Hyalangium rubrum TaxID=3103134 RepID=A0ABU5GW41_9BACT|nr:DUSAM domain-containing protein [Hyalangium sp. s54d21]MDY7225408.1 DUSAM domain-containing protein [Hyalangium sp. s54d21]
MARLDADVDAIWNQLWELESQVHRGETLKLTEDVRDLLRSAAPTVAIHAMEAETALGSTERATELLREIRARVREGSNRLSDALHRMYSLRDAGDLDGACQQMRDLLAVEVVPLYRDIAEGQLERLAELA